MAGFHINANNEHKPCNADKRACRYGGESDGNHFSTEGEAKVESEKRLTEQYGNLSTAKQKHKNSNKGSMTAMDKLAVTDADGMSKEDMTNFASGEASHNIRKVVGQWRLAASDGNLEEMEKISTNLHKKNLEETIETVGDKFSNLTAEDKDDLKLKLMNRMSKVFQKYKEDDENLVPLEPVFDGWGNDVMKTVEKRKSIAAHKNALNDDGSREYASSFKEATSSMAERNYALGQVSGVRSSEDRNLSYDQQVNDQIAYVGRALDVAEKNGTVTPEMKEEMLSRVKSFENEVQEIREMDISASKRVLYIDEASEEMSAEIKDEIANGKHRAAVKDKQAKREAYNKKYASANSLKHNGGSAQKLIESFSTSGRGRTMNSFIDAIDKRRGGGSWMGASQERASYVPVQTNFGKVEMVVKRNYGLLSRGSKPTDGKTNHIIFKVNEQYFRVDGHDKADGWGVRWDDKPYEVPPVESDLSRRR